MVNSVFSDMKKYAYSAIGGLVCVIGIVFFVFATQTAHAPIQNSVSNTVGTASSSAEVIMPITAVDPNRQSVTLDPYAKVFTITAVNFSFDVTTITVKKGETVTINLESTDGYHNWTLDGFNVQTVPVHPGTQASVTFVADTVGTYEYYCSMGTHREEGMVGKLIVEE